MSLHTINVNQITKLVAGVSITRTPDGYEDLPHTMRVGLWVKTDGINRPVAWALVDDENIIKCVTNLAQGDWSATWDILDNFQENVRNTWDPESETFSALTREMRDECTDYDVYICAQDIRTCTPEDVINALDSATLARCYSALGVRYEWWQNEDGGHALVPRLAQAQDLTPGSLRLPILVWDASDDYAPSSLEDFVGAELEPIMSHDEDSALEGLADLIAVPDYRTAWDYSAREIPEWYEGNVGSWSHQTDFDLV